MLFSQELFAYFVTTSPVTCNNLPRIWGMLLQNFTPTQTAPVRKVFAHSGSDNFQLLSKDLKYVHKKNQIDYINSQVAISKKPKIVTTSPGLPY